MTGSAGETPAPDRGGAYTYRGAVRWEYSPELDDEPDPGEIVWAWVAFEEDDSVGKDRPVAVVGRADDGRLVALMLSSQNHRGHSGWILIGSGPWDREGRDSWLRGDRLLAVPSAAVRREGAVIPRATYDRILRQLGVTRRAGLATRIRRLFSRRSAG